MQRTDNTSSRITKDQIEQLVQIMEKNPDVAKGICSNPGLFWHEVSIELNSFGPSKDKHSWKNTWADKKSNVKKKFNQIRIRITNIKVNADGVKGSTCIGAPTHTSIQQPEQPATDSETVPDQTEVEQNSTLTCSNHSITSPALSHVQPEVQQKSSKQVQSGSAKPPATLEMNPNPLSELVSCFKVYVEGTLQFQKEVLEHLRAKQND